ncbi:ArsR/SmtB family transcription factor [Amycolatopsis aidingensis]|uniref:ArsR/SmtB family transcription factor n=1 Tax=Amycolatopsis aidingensis TaxID=2842453 RepID=UPI001C0C88D7|nr:winged helix-turn-helix domain-containing protein [Amycolatopsis aidingensis]
MIVLRFDTATIARTRLAVSPMLEALVWLELTVQGRRHPVFGDPGPRARGALGHPDVALLADLQPPGGSGYTADLLTPQPRAVPPEDLLEAQLADLEAAAQDEVELQVLTYAEAHWGRPVPPRVRALVESGQLPRRAAAGFARFWQETLAEDWPTLRDALDGDLARRARTMATHGVGRLLGTLHPQLTWTGSALVVDKPYAEEREVHDRDVVVAASLFTWPQAMVQVDDPDQLVVYYPAASIGTGRGPSRLAEVFGATRAQLLADLDSARSTSELATRHDLAPATVSYHLRALHRARLVVRNRDGRHVLYQRSTQAEALL